MSDIHVKIVLFEDCNWLVEWKPGMPSIKNDSFVPAIFSLPHQKREKCQVKHLIVIKK